MAVSGRPGRQNMVVILLMIISFTTKRDMSRGCSHGLLRLIAEDGSLTPEQILLVCWGLTCWGHATDIPVRAKCIDWVSERCSLLLENKA